MSEEPEPPDAEAGYRPGERAIEMGGQLALYGGAADEAAIAPPSPKGRWGKLSKLLPFAKRQAAAEYAASAPLGASCKLGSSKSWPSAASQKTKEASPLSAKGLGLGLGLGSKKESTRGKDGAGGDGFVTTAL